MDMVPGLANLTVSAWGVVVRCHPTSDRKLGRVALDNDSRDFVPQHMRNFLVHVPTHEFAGTKARGFGSHEKPTGRAFRHRGDFKMDHAAAEISRYAVSRGSL